MKKEDRILELLMQQPDLILILEKLKIGLKEEIKKRKDFYILPNKPIDFLSINWESDLLQ